MFILVVEPGKAPVTREIDGSLREMQKIVGGKIEAVYPFAAGEIALVCNEEGPLLGLPPNRGLRDENGDLYDIVCGTFFLCGSPSDMETFSSLTPEQIARLERQYHTPEIFVGMSGRIVCLPME